MKYYINFLLFALSILPLNAGIINKVVMRHPVTGQTVVLLGDYHFLSSQEQTEQSIAMLKAVGQTYPVYFEGGSLDVSDLSQEDWQEFSKQSTLGSLFPLALEPKNGLFINCDERCEDSDIAAAHAAMYIQGALEDIASEGAVSDLVQEHLIVMSKFVAKYGFEPLDLGSLVLLFADQSTFFELTNAKRLEIVAQAEALLEERLENLKKKYLDGLSMFCTPALLDKIGLHFDNLPGAERRMRSFGVLLDVKILEKIVRSNQSCVVCSGAIHIENIRWILECVGYEQACYHGITLDTVLNHLRELSEKNPDDLANLLSSQADALLLASTAFDGVSDLLSYAQKA